MKCTESAALAMHERLPSYCLLEWCRYKGATYVAQPNIEATQRAGKPMLDLSYCLTEAMNENVLLTVQYDKSKFTA